MNYRETSCYFHAKCLVDMGGGGGGGGGDTRKPF